MSRLIDNTIKAEWTNADALDLQPTCNQLATDCISRQAAIDAANRTDYTGLAVEDVKKVTDEVVKELKQLPSAQPEPKWIPVTKKAHPDLPIRVQVQMDNGWIITAYYQEGEWLSVPDCGESLLDNWIEAWRELPEPWKGEQNE